MLEVKDLTVRFHSREDAAVRGVSLSVPDGGALGLAGESGSGKSTVALAVAGLLDPAACVCGGEILLDGRDLLSLSEKDKRAMRGKAVATVFQDPVSAMDPLMRVGRQVEEALLLHEKGTSAAERKARALEALAQAELPEPERIYRSFPHQLSGGQLQRAMIAAAVISQPRLLLLDEPTTALDVTVQAQILALLKKLNEKNGVSMLFISHDLRVIRKLCPRCAVMQNGALVETGETQTLFTSPRHPYTKRLIAAVPRLRFGGRDDA